MQMVSIGINLRRIREDKLWILTADLRRLYPRTDRWLSPVVQLLNILHIKTPTLVISAVDDPLALHENARALADRIPGASRLSVPDGGHVLLGHHEEVKNQN
jgi:2-hydroxy-6-oxonona-2,4-dienedioate hydrolase